MWKRRSPPASNKIYRRLFDNTCTRELECFLAQVNSRCTINSLRRILRPSDHELLGGVVLPSYIQLGNETVHELTVGNARDTVLYYLADPSRGGGQGMAPEQTMGRDLEALLCLLLDLKSLDEVNLTLEGTDFINAVSRTMNNKPCSPWSASSSYCPRRKRPKSSLLDRNKIGCEDIDTIMEMAPNVQAWVDKLEKGTTVEHSQTSAIPFFSVPGVAINLASSNEPIPSGSGQYTGKAPLTGQYPGPSAFSQPLQNPATKSMFQSYRPLAPVPELRPKDSPQYPGHTSDLNPQPLLSSKNHGLRYTREMAPPPSQPRPEPHVTDLLLYTVELSIKQSKIDAQKKQLDECKNVLTQLIHLCEELSNNPLAITRDVVQDFLQDIVSGLVQGGVFSEKVGDKVSKDAATPSIPGPIRRGPMTRSQANRATPARVINGPSEGGSGAGPTRSSVHESGAILDVLNPRRAAPEPGPSSAHKQAGRKPQSWLRKLLNLRRAPKKTRVAPYPRCKTSKPRAVARDVLISSLETRIKAAQKKIDKGQGDVVGQQNLKILQQQIQHLQEIELTELGPGAMENAAHQQLRKELEKKIRKKTQQVKQGRALDVNAPMLSGFKELLYRLTAVGAGKRDRQEMEAGEESLPSRSAWKGKGKEVENSLSKVQDLFGNHHLADCGTLSTGGEIDAAVKIVNAAGESGEEHTRKQIRTRGQFLGGGFGGSNLSRDQAHIPVIVLDGDSTDGVNDNDTFMENFADYSGETGNRCAEPDQEMADAIPAPWKFNTLADKAPPVYRFGAPGAPASVINAENNIPAANVGTAGPLGFGTIRGIGAMKNTFSGPHVSRSGLGPVFGTSGFGANPATFVFAGPGKGKEASLFGSETAPGTGGGRGTGDSPILIEDSD
ncbi:hypothetical protein L211DRAFT_851853 [Terfezia boudieri ATCC MYA-4762]|uniref:Uncharacterized protein n=1 Tax=Terfezia boudieri ATCC MYA-4762 TaxID=1051890 RepID=A0A3N4LDK6_9PEZI|nr:hypothetical protein L211DRAFT_851853 [Terfezia boudieri ATCC MYA-4762]